MWQFLDSVYKHLFSFNPHPPIQLDHSQKYTINKPPGSEFIDVLISEFVSMSEIRPLDLNCELSTRMSVPKPFHQRPSMCLFSFYSNFHLLQLLFIALAPVNFSNQSRHTCSITSSYFLQFFDFHCLFL